MGYQITYKASFKKELRRLHPTIRRAVVKRILALADDPRPNGCVKLVGSENTYRIRQGNYRVMYNVYDDLIVVEVIKVDHRSDVYRKS